MLPGTFFLIDHSYSGVASYTGASFKLWWDNPFAFDGRGILAVSESSVAGLYCARKFQVTLHREMLSLRGLWVLIPFHSHSGYMFTKKSGGKILCPF